MSEQTDRYTYRVVWSEEDEMYVGLCAEFGALSHLDDTPEAAFAGIPASERGGRRSWGLRCESERDQQMLGRGVCPLDSP